LTGQMDLSSANEGVALSNNTDIASFTVNNTTDTANAFTATIDWGDGTTTAGTVVGSNGSFTVDGGHTYADEGSPLATVTITRTADSTQIAPTGTVSVADTDNISVQGRTLTGNPNTPLTNVTVATFTTSNGVNTASDFAVNIDWGDGTTTLGTVSGSGGSFSVQGSHTYTAAGDDTITIFVNDDAADAAFSSGTSQALIGVSFGGHVVLNAATEGQALGSGTTVATFGDSNNSDTAANFTSTIAWGDGTTSAGTIVGSNGSFTVQGNHTYTDEGSLPASVLITRTTDNATAQPSGTVVVSEADLLTPTPKTIGGQPGVLISNAVVATFSDVNTGNVAGDFTATIDWGDGTSSAGTVSGSGATFSVSGSHTYATAGQDTISVTLKDDDPGTGTATANSTAFIGFSAGDVVLTDATEGQALGNGTTVATFGDSNNSDTAASFTATIAWGDGTTTSGATIVGSNGSFTVDGGHTYADEGAFQPNVTVKRTSDSAVVVDTGSVAVAEADVLTPQGTTINGSPNQALSNVVVATFTDTNTANAASDFTATVDWGDGTTTPGTVSGSGGTFSVAGTHTYATDGHDTIKVSLTDDAPGTATATATSAANIGLAGQVVLTSATERVALASNTVVATYVDSNGGDTAGSFTATINWGDGTTSAGTVSGGAGTFTVSGGHTYADEGNLPVIATLTRTSDQETGTSSGSVAVAEHDVLSAQGTTLIGKFGQALSNATVATFTDTDTAAPANDFTATIDWGDGTTTAGIIAGSNGAFSVSGTHAYATGGFDTVTVKVTDDAPGTATATATGAATIAGPPTPISAEMFTRRTTDGTFDLYQINANTVASFNTLGVVGVNFQVAGFGDFNHDGSTDMMLRDTNTGQFEVYDIVNSHITSASNIGAVGLNFQVAGFGDFNGDGTTDMMLRNTSTGQFEVYDIVNNHITSASNLGTVGTEWQVAGFGDFNHDGTTDMMLRNSTSGVFELYSISNNAITGAFNVGQVGLDWQVAGFGDFNGDGTTDMLLRNTSTGVFEFYDLNANKITSTGVLGQATTDWQVAGVGDFNGDGTTDIMLRNPSVGTFEIYDVKNNQVTGAGPFGAIGTEWQVAGFGVAPATMGGGGQAGAPSSAYSDLQLSQLVQAMSGFSSGGAAVDHGIIGQGTQDGTLQMPVIAGSSFHNQA
jgi:hypothetical protein